MGKKGSRLRRWIGCLLLSLVRFLGFLLGRGRALVWWEWWKPFFLIGPEEVFLRFFEISVWR